MYSEDTDFSRGSQDKKTSFLDNALKILVEHMAGNGFLWPPKVFKTDGEWHRFTVPSSKHKNNADGSYRLVLNGESLTGTYRNFKEADVFYFHHGKAQSFLERYTAMEPAKQDHPYLIKKKISDRFFRQQDDRIFVPCFDSENTCQGLQWISGDGAKKWESGSKKNGCRLRIPGDDHIVYIVEGMATGASVHEVTGNTVIIAFDAFNLISTAKITKSEYPNSRIIIAADNDISDKTNVGVQQARKAAGIVGADVLISQTPDGRKCDFNDIFVWYGADECRKQLTLPPEESAGARGFKLKPVGELNMVKIDWLIRGILEADSLALIFGDPGTYKSFLAVDFACCIASGKDFVGSPVKQGAVIYIAGEGTNGIARRFKAWSIRNQIPLDGLPLLVSTAPIGIGDKDAVDIVLSEIKRMTEKYGEPAMIVVDTLARNYGSGDENSTQDMTRFVSGCDKIKAQYRSTILLVHHCGLADKTRSRGSMALKGALDAEYRLDKDETGCIRFEATKMKDADMPEPMAFRPAVVELGEIDGEMVTSVVLDSTSYEPPPKQGKEGRGKWQTMAMETLRKMFKERVQNLEDGGFDPDTARVSVNDWRDAVFDAGMKHRSTWKKIVESLVKQETVFIDHGFVEIV